MYNWMEIISSSLAILVYLCMFNGPFLFALALHKNRKKLNTEIMRKRFGTLYEGLRKGKETRIWYIPMIMARIVFMVIAIVFYRNNSFL